MEGLQADKEEIRRCMVQAMKVEDVSVEMIIETTDLSADELTAL